MNRLICAVVCNASTMTGITICCTCTTKLSQSTTTCVVS